MQNSNENQLMLENKQSKTVKLESKETGTRCMTDLSKYKNESDSKHLSPQVLLTWTDVSAYFIPPPKTQFCSPLRKKIIQPIKQILNKVNGLARPGELLAIMGGSGAGKTTLLNILTKKTLGMLTVSGQVYINDQPVTSDIIAAMAAYVQQDDLFIGTLTVREQLIFQARLTMGNTTHPEQLKRVDEVIQELGLSKCQNTLIGIIGRIKGISGGEKRRLAIGCEILTVTPLLVCDEPTSGLDSFMAQSVVKILQKLAIKGKTVICTIHQPSSEIYATFDKVLFLAEGRLAYLGSKEYALKFFENLNFKCPINYNPADHFIHTLSVTAEATEEKMLAISEICKAFEKSDTNAFIKEEIDSIIKNVKFPDQITKSRYKVAWIEQFRAVMWRSWMCIYKEPTLIRVRVMQAILIGLLLGFIYYHQELTQLSIVNINGAMYVLLMECTYSNTFAVVHVFTTEFPIFLREHSSGLYSSGVYFFCKTFADVRPIYCINITGCKYIVVPTLVFLIMLILQFVFIITPIVFTTTSYWLIGFNPDITKFFIACLIFVLVANAASSFGYLVSSISSSIALASTIIPSAILPLYLFGGFFIHKNSIPWYFRWIPRLSWFAYGFESLLINQWEDVKRIECNVNNKTCPSSGLLVLKSYGFETTAFWPNIYGLVALIISIRFVAFLVVAIRASKNRKKQ